MTVHEFNDKVVQGVKELLHNNMMINDAKNQLAQRVEAILLQKHDEYARDDDALSNFKEGSRLFGDTPEKVLMYYKLKHDISLKKLVDDLPNLSFPMFLEKITDDIAYLILLYVHLCERERLRGG